MDDEQRAAVWAKRGYIGYFIGRIVGGLTSIIVFNHFIDDLRHAIDTNTAYQPHDRGLQLISSPASLASFAGLIMIVIWAFKAATVARNLHFPAVRSPVWAVAGWFVPIVNFWFPYQCVRDCLRPGNPERQRVKAWWAAYLVALVLAFAAVIVSVFSSYGVAVAVALPATLAACFELNFALGIIDAISAEHAAAVRQL